MRTVPSEPDWRAIRRRVDAEHEAEIVKFYQRPLDAREIEEFVDAGYELPSVHGRWARPPVDSDSLDDTKRAPSGETICLTCGSQLLDVDHQDWCWCRVRARPVEPDVPPTPARRPPRVDDRDRRQKYLEVALEREADACRAAPEGLRQETLSRAAWALARFHCGGELTEGDILAALVPAGLATGLGRREVTSTIRSALRRRCRGVAA
jgi:hypothetical protein